MNNPIKQLPSFFFPGLFLHQTEARGLYGRPPPFFRQEAGPLKLTDSSLNSDSPVYPHPACLHDLEVSLKSFAITPQLVNRTLIRKGKRHFLQFSKEHLRSNQNSTKLGMLSLIIFPPRLDKATLELFPSQKSCSLLPLYEQTFARCCYI